MARSPLALLARLAPIVLVTFALVACTSTTPPPTLGDDAAAPVFDASTALDAAAPSDAAPPHEAAAADVTVPVNAGGDATVTVNAGEDASPPEAASDAPLAVNANDASPLADSAIDAPAEEAGEDAGNDGGPADAGDASACPGGCPASCAAIAAHDAGAPDGTYTIDPGSGPIAVACLMSVNGGGWTPLVPEVAAALDTVTSKVYLYAYGAAWYEAPASTLAWSWSSGQELVGTYSYFDGAKASSFDCTGSGEVPAFGVGCSNGPGGTLKTLPYYSDDPANAQCEICQDQPNAFGTGACATGVKVYVR